MEIMLLEKQHEMKPVFEIPNSVNIKNQVKMLRITKNDLAMAQLLKPYVEKHIYEIVDVFYKTIKENRFLTVMIETFGSFKQHKKLLRKHIINMFSGVINQDFFNKRESIANVHLEIGLTQEWYIASFESIFRALVDTIKLYFSKKENIYIATKVINKLINLEIQVVLKAYNNKMNLLKDKEEEAKEKLMYMAFYDETTNLPKRNKTMSDIDKLIANNKRFALIHMEVRHVKFLGQLDQHDLNRFFCAIIDRLKIALSGLNYEFGKLDGFEFTIIIKNYQTKEALEKLLEQVLNSMKLPLKFHKREFYLTTSFGVTTYPNKADSAQTLLHYASLALNEQKKLKQNGYSFFTPGLKEKYKSRINFENYLRKAIEKDELELHYQPQIDSMTNTLIGLESLVRWNHPHKGMVSPGTFIPLAEETGIIYDITNWVLEETCRHLHEWHQKNYSIIPVWINISSLQFYDSNFVKSIRDILKVNKIDPQYLGLEITESAMIDPVISEYQLNELNELGVQISLDDFGTGYSSLSYLHTLPVHGLKIDRNFIMNVTECDNNQAIVESIITLANQLKLTIIAEGVETKEQLDFLQQLNCYLIQGYYYSKPLPKDKIEQKFLVKHTMAKNHS